MEQLNDIPGAMAVLRKAARSVGHRQVPPRLRELLREHDWTPERIVKEAKRFLDDKEELSDFFAAAAALDAPTASTPAKSRQQELPLAVWRQQAVRRARELAARASKHPDVVEFRASVFPPTSSGFALLDAPAVDSCARWIETRLPPDGPTPVRLLHYCPTDDRTAHVNVAGMPVLEHLADVTEKLRDKFGWEPPHAVLFVLAGVIPICWPVSVAVEHAPPGPRRRVVVRAEPWVPAVAVEKLYRDAVKGVGRPTPRLTSEARGARRRALAKFLHFHSDGSWEEKRRKWNRMNGKDWPYESQATFGRDGREALKRYGA